MFYLPNDLNHLGNLTSSPEVDGRDGAMPKLDATFGFRVRDDDGLFSLFDVVPNASAVCLMPL